MHCVHLTIFTNVKVLLPLLIFRRAGKRINIEENSCRDKRVVVKFQQKAWCDEKAIIKWISEEWENVLLNSKSAGSKYADQNSSSGKSFADSSSEDCWNLEAIESFLAEKRFHEKLVVLCTLSTYTIILISP